MKKIFSYALIIMALTNSNFSNAQNASINNPNPIQQYPDNYLSDYTKINYISTVGMTLKCRNSQGDVLADAYSGKLGFAGTDIENKKTDKEDIFQIGSITKSFISVVLLQLEAENKLSIDDTVGKWFPADKYPQYQIWKDIKIRQLMNMTSGIPDYYRTNQYLMNLITEYPYTELSLTKILNYETAVKVEFPPGTKYDYSNTNYTLLGLLIENITGNNFRLEVQNRIITKLGLAHTYFPEQFEYEDPNQDKIHLVHGYNETGPYAPNEDITDYNLSFYNSAGGIISNTNDINIYLQNLFNPGTLLTADQIEKLEKGEPGIVAQDDTDFKIIYGLGIMQIYDKTKSETFYAYEGQTLGTLFSYLYYPNRPVTITFAVNSDSNKSDSSFKIPIKKLGASPFNYIYNTILPGVFGGSNPLCAIQP